MGGGDSGENPRSNSNLAATAEKNAPVAPAAQNETANKNAPATPRPRKIQSAPRKMPRPRTYDLIFSLGEACSCTQALRAAGLQCFSYPFDWLVGGDFAGRARLVATGFERFLRREDLRFEREDAQFKTHIYRNDFTQIFFIHDFHKGREFSAAFDEVAGKYQRRIARLLAQISCAKRVLAVFVELPNRAKKLADDEILRTALAQFDAKFGAKFEILYFTRDESFALGSFERREIAPRITKIVGNYAKFAEPKGADEAYLVSEAVLARALAGVALAPSLRRKAAWLKVRRLLLRGLFLLVPIRSWRMVLHAKYMY